MANLSRLVAASFFSLALLSSFVFTANLSCLLATTFFSLSFLSNSFSAPRFNLLRVARCYLSWSSVSDDLFFSSCSFWFSFLLYLVRILSSAFHSSVLRSLELCLLISMYFFGFLFVHAKATLVYRIIWVSQVNFSHPKLTLLSIRMFGPRNSAHAFGIRIFCMDFL